MSNLARRLSGIVGLGPQDAAPIVIQFGTWFADLPELSNPGAITATNVTPKEDSYGPFPDLVSQSSALDERCRGATAAKDSDGNAYFYCGDAAKLYQVRDLTLTEKGTGFSTSQTWEFAAFADTLIATNYDDAIQSITIGSGGNFAAHITSTNKPMARHMAVVRNFLVLGNTNDTTDGVKTSRLWWSAIGDSTDFDPDAATQSDFEDLKEGGAVQRVVGGADYGVIFQENLIRRLEYVGSPLVFDPVPVDRERGTPIPGSVVAQGRRVYYISEEGFFVFTGSQSIPIGANRYDRRFWNQFDIGNADRVYSAIDRINKLVCWTFPGEGSSGEPNKLVVYNWVNDRFAEIDIEAQILVNAFTQGFTLEELDTINNDLDALTPSLDSDQWKGGDINFAAFDNQNRLALFTGDNLEAILDTGEFQLGRGRRGYIDFVRALVEEEAGATVPPSSIQLALGSRNLLTDAPTFSGFVVPQSDGLHSFSSNARYHRVRLKVLAGATWEHALGVEVTGSVQGLY